MAEPEAFIVMQFGSDELERVCQTAIVPAIQEAGLKDRRVDRDHQGHMLKAEIIEFLENSEIIVADLTNERPNCYLEVGYAMGLKKNANLILTVRHDHHPSGQGWTKAGPQVHFDLTGYPLIFWTPDDLPKFRSDLAQEIVRRRSSIARSGTRAPAPANLKPPIRAWRDPLRSIAFNEFPSAKLTIGEGGYLPAYFEVAAEIDPPASASVGDLATIQRYAVLDHTGWPFGVVGQGDQRPKVKRDGIENVLVYEGHRGSVDCSKLFTDGRIWVFRDLIEDREPREDHQPRSVFYSDLQTAQVAEALVFITRLYRRMNATDDDLVTVELSFSGLNERRLEVNERRRMSPRNRISYEDDVDFTISAPLAELESDVRRYTREFMAQVFVLFDGIAIGDEILDAFITPVLESVGRT